MKRVGYLVADSTRLSPEEAAAWKFLLPHEQFRNTLLPFAQLPQSPSALKELSALWWHYDSSTSLPPFALDPTVVTTIRNYIMRGGSLFLSLLAAQYVVDIGIEEARQNMIEKGPWNRNGPAEKHDDIRGLSSFRGHPIFDGLHGAAYLWNPSPHRTFAGASYEAPATPRNGRVVAVEREYIRLNEDSRIAVEYRLGRGRVLAVGSFMFFADEENRFRVHLEKFTHNCLVYLTQTGHRKNPGVKSKEHRGATTFWNFEPRTVRFQACKPQKRIRLLPRSWHPTPSGLSLSREQATENSFDVGGRRALIMGSEKSGIEEVWAQPLRILRDVRISLRVGDGQALPAETLQPHIMVRPESLTRTFRLKAATIEETTFADTKRPAGGIHFEVGGHETVELILTAIIDLRIMWPLSDRATGSLVYSWDDGLQAVVVDADALHATAILGCSLQPSEYIVGRYAEIKDDAGRFVGIPTNATHVAIGLRYQIDKGTPGCTFVFAGSSVDQQDARAAYKNVLNNPLAKLNSHARYFKSLLRDFAPPEASHATSDPDLRSALLWALVATDRFFVETPGIGTSLMAGYATTRSGWNGGQTISGRPGYAWYFGRDSAWTALAMLAYGDYAKVRSVLEFMGNYQDLTGKIAHEITTSGHIHYDAADATPLYVVLMGRYLRASGDKKFVSREFSRVLKAITFCLSTDTDGDHLIENTHVGHGWIEGGPLFPAHAEMYLNACWAAALEEAGFMAGELNRIERRVWIRESKQIRHILNEKFWNPVAGSFSFALNVDGTVNATQTILPAVAMYFGLVDAKKAGQSLRLYASSKFSTDWGVRLVASDEAQYNPTAYHYGSIWPLFTGWTALAETRHGMREQALRRMEGSLMLHTKFALGSIPEVLHGDRCEPAGVCTHQAWSEALTILGLVESQKNLTPAGRIPHHTKKKRIR